LQTHAWDDCRESQSLGVEISQRAPKRREDNIQAAEVIGSFFLQVI
jgi:hypothetical protein